MNAKVHADAASPKAQPSTKERMAAFDKATQQIESKTMSTADSLVSALSWFRADAENGGHREDCFGGRECHCGFENLVAAIGHAANELRRLSAK